MNKIMFIIGIFILLIALVFLLSTGDMANARYIFAAGVIYMVFSYFYKQYPKISKVLLIIFTVIFILAMAMVLGAKFS
jgi:hypothetical protein